MPAARYWRITQVETPAGGDLELSEVQLHHATGRADAAVTITCNFAPVIGAIADLQDGAADSPVRFAAAAVKSPGFFLQWDFGANVDVVKLLLGSGSAASLFPVSLTLETAPDGVTWAAASDLPGIQWPGTFTALPLADATTVVEETFATAPAPGLIVPVTGTYTKPMSVAWSDPLKALVCTATGGYQNFTLLRFLPPVDLSKDLVMEADFQYVTDTYSYEHFGLYIGDGSNRGWRVAALNGTFTASFFDNGAESTNFVKTYTGPGLNIVPGVVYKWVLQRSAGGVFTLAIDGVIQAIWAADTRSFAAAVYFGLHSYGGCVTYLHRVAQAFSHRFAPRNGRTEIKTRGVSWVPFHSDPTPYRPITTAGLPAAKSWRDMVYAGNYTVSGTVKQDGDPVDMPLHRKVSLLYATSWTLIRETWSDPVTGAYAFLSIDNKYEYTVVSVDYEQNFRAVIADRITADPMP